MQCNVMLQRSKNVQRSNGLVLADVVFEIDVMPAADFTAGSTTPVIPRVQPGPSTGFAIPTADFTAGPIIPAMQSNFLFNE
jgi:hypothetical protein